jgi:hypothetical protein
MHLRSAIVYLFLSGIFREAKSNDISASHAYATDCAFNFKTGESSCKIDTSELVNGIEPTLKLIVKEGGRTITCTQGTRGDRLDNW